MPLPPPSPVEATSGHKEIDKVVPADGTENLSKDEASALQAAKRKYATLRAPETLMSRLFRAHAEDFRRRSDPVLKSEKWPEQLADQCAREARAYLHPNFISPTGEFQLLPNEGFDTFHVRRNVMREFNELVAASDKRDAAQHPDASDTNTALGRKRDYTADFLRRNKPEFFEQPDWPERLTRLCIKPEN
jgi:hypothetical protein